MAIQAIRGGLWLPGVPSFSHAAPAVTFLQSVSAAGGKAAFIFAAPKAGAIRTIIWGTGTVTTGATVDIRLESLDETVTPSVPSGSLFGTNTNASQVVANGDDNVIFATTLTADATVTKGQKLAFVIANASPGSMNIPRCYDPGTTHKRSFPYGLHYNGTSWIASTTSYIPALAVEYDDGTYEPIVGMLPPATTVTATAMNTGTTPDVGGLRFTPAVGLRASRAWAMLNVVAGANFKVMLVSTAYHQANATGILATATFDGDTRNTAAGLYFLEFDGTVDLTAATAYRLIVEPTSGSSVSIYDVAMQSLAMLDAWEGGQAFHLTTAKDPTGDGSWTNYNSGTFRVPFMGLQFDGVDVPAGGSGGVMGSRIFTGF